MKREAIMISVVIGSYNGARFIGEQLSSILPQLSDKDEVVISDNGSSDGTLEIVTAFDDSRIKVISYTVKTGPVHNFENALLHARGSIIVLADQDDVWLPTKIESIRKVFESIEHRGKPFVLHQNSKCVNEQLDDLCKEPGKETTHEEISASSGLLKNFYKNRYIGCHMSFNRELIDIVLPFPRGIPMHDYWIGMCCEVFGESEFDDEVQLLFRRGDHNFTTKDHKLWRRIKWRYTLFLSLCSRWFRESRFFGR